MDLWGSNISLKLGNFIGKHSNLAKASQTFIFREVFYVAVTLSLSCSIEWDDSEVVLVRETEVARREGIAGLSDVGTISTVDGCWTVTVGHIVDEDRVPYVRINISHIQRERGNPEDAN